MVISKLFYWQIIKNPDLAQRVINQNYKPQLISPKRGIIYDSNNYPLVLNQSYYQLSIYKPDLKTKSSELLNFIENQNPNLSSDDKNQIIRFLTNPDIKWVTLKSLFDYEQKQNISDPGITFSIINERYYPEGDLASLVLGSPNIGGLESYYQKQLSGRYGYSWQNVDAVGHTILTKPGWYLSPRNGLDLHIFLNRQIQFLAEKSLKEGISKYDASSGSITIIDPKSGGILAMTSLVATQSATASAYKNPIIADLFEPGSIFKPLVVSMALDKHTIDTNYICTKCGQPHQIGEYSISNWDNSLHPDSRLRDIIKNSDNIGMSYIIAALGQSNFLNYFKALGLDRKTNIDLQGETKPLPKTNWPEIDFATASFGQGFAITQIQMLQAFNTIANNGIKSKPHLVEYFDNNDQTIRNNLSPPEIIFDPETIQTVKSILKYAVENGVVSKFKPENLEVCAKSGTAQVAIKGGYSESATNASYVGFSPCQNPKFTMIVTINNPKSSPWGSSTAAPIWFELASEITPLL